jgi:parallel beta-helix repeat protein
LYGNVVTSPSGAGNTTRIDGFIIQNGTGEHIGSYDYGGGGIYCYYSSPTISNNTIRGNKSNKYDGRSRGLGGGICCYYSSPIIINNTISGNRGTHIWGDYNSYGGGIYCYSCHPTIINNTISGNIASHDGGGIYCYNSSPTISNNIIAFNGTGIYKGDSAGTPILRNNCVFNPTYNYSGLSAGEGDINIDPLLWDRAENDFHLTSDSPCIDAGNDIDVQTGWLDMDGEDRIVGPHVDMGADEHFAPPIIALSSNAICTNTMTPGGNILQVLLRADQTRGDVPDTAILDFGDGASTSLSLPLPTTVTHEYSLASGENSRTFTSSASARNFYGDGSAATTFTILRQPEIALSVNEVSAEDNSITQVNVVKYPVLNLSLCDSLGFIENVRFQIPSKGLDVSGTDLTYSGTVFDQSDIGKVFSLLTTISNTGTGVNSVC